MSKGSANSVAPSRDEMAGEFGTYGKTQSIKDWKDGTQMITFENPRPIDRVLLKCVLKDKDKAEGYKPNKWYSYEGNKFRVKFLEVRPPPSDDPEDVPLRETFNKFATAAEEGEERGSAHRGAVRVGEGRALSAWPA